MTYVRDYSSWVEIDLEKIRNNVRYVIHQTNVQVMAIVKSNGYGHGAVQVGRAAIEGGATWCGVARVEEAIDLRNSGLNCPILLLGYTPPGKYAKAIENHISITVWDKNQCIDLAKTACILNIPARVHVKVDTGLSRLGIQSKQAVNLIKMINSTNGIYLEGLFTHFARADEIDPTSTDNQLRLFNDLITELTSKNQIPAIVHASNSAGTFRRSDAKFNMVRLGIALYGLQPSKQWKLPPNIQPALCWKSVLSQVKLLPPHRGVSYGHIYITKGNERIGTIAVGYADGYRRKNGNHVLIQGKRAPIVGKVCMDQIMVHLDDIPNANVGDEVVLIGQQDNDLISVEEIAQVWETINYEVVCGISQRVPRIYLH